MCMHFFNQIIKKYKYLYSCKKDNSCTPLEKYNAEGFIHTNQQLLLIKADHQLRHLRGKHLGLIQRLPITKVK